MPKASRGVKVHISTRLDSARHPVKSPPCTRVIDTVIDLTQTARTIDDAISWLSRACGSRLTTADRLAAAVDARKKLRWRRELSYALSDVADGDHSLLEFRYHRNVERAHGLPTAKRQRPQVSSNRRRYRDVRYIKYSTVAELDGRVDHEFEWKFRDNKRDNAAVVRGDAPLRFGWDAVELEPCETAAQVAIVLMRNGWAGRPRQCRPGCQVDSFLDQWREEAAGDP